MTTTPQTKHFAKQSTERPMLQINDETDRKLKKYLQFASEQMKAKITNDDVVEYALNLLFDRDGAFKTWSKTRK